jgi:hypothetical protein
MSPDDTNSDDSEHSNGESTVDGGGHESQPRDPETGQFLPKDERAETETTGSAGRETGTPGDDRPTATRPRGQRPREPPEQHRQRASLMRLYTLAPTHPLVRSTAGPTASEAASGRDLSPALDLVALQVQRDGRPILRDRVEAANRPGPGQPVPNPRTRPPVETVAQTPPTAAWSHTTPTDAGPEAGSGPGQPAGSERGQWARQGGSRWYRGDTDA